MRAKLPVNDPAVAKLIEKQMRNWEYRKSRREEIPVPDRPEVADFIAVSRAVGAGGGELARKLGAKLGWPVFDKEILGVMAGSDELLRAVYESLDERDLNWCEETLRPLMQPGFVKNDYFHRLTRTVLSLVRQGEGVFLGRGANLILPSDRGLRVYLVAPREQRVQRFADLRNFAVEQAGKEVDRIDRERNEFIRRHFQRERGDVTAHDLTVNLARLTIDQAVDLVLATRTILASGK